MIQTVRSLLRRSLGLRIVAISLLIAIAGIAPLLLYVAIGPSDGNPIGLGLLAVLSGAIGTLGALIGVVSYLVQAVARAIR
jgi:hypothetical protein